MDQGRIRQGWMALAERVRETTWSGALRVLAYLVLLSLIAGVVALAFASRGVASGVGEAPSPTASAEPEVAEEAGGAGSSPATDVGRFSSGPWSAPATTAAGSEGTHEADDRSTRPPSTSGSTTTSSIPTSTSADLTTTIPSTPSPSTEGSTIVDGVDAVGDTILVEAGKDEKIKVLDNDGSPNSKLDQATLTIITSPTQAEEYRVHGDHVHYRSLSDASGADRLRYRICDEAGRCAEATVVITIE